MAADPHVLAPGTLPTPFTADEIREGSPVGKSVRLLIEVDGQEPIVRVNRWVACDAEGAIVEKKRNDVFRHWLLGFGTGDLLIRLGGPGGQTIELENVIAINHKLPLIQRLVKEKAITVDEGTTV